MAFGLSLEAVLLLKEVADFLQIGLVASQTAKRFSGSRVGRGGTVGIDGNVVRVQVGPTAFTLPLEDAAAAAGVAGAGGRGSKPPTQVELVTAGAKRLQEWLHQAVPGVPPGFITQLSRPRAGEDVEAGSRGVNPDERPFGLREFVAMQSMGAARRAQAEGAAALALEALRQIHGDRVSALDAQIARERIAAEKDITRMKIVAQLEEQRRDVQAKFELQERDLASRLQLQREKLAAEGAQLERRLVVQGALDGAERVWKTQEAAADRAWRERTKKEGDDWASYYKNLNADLALTRSVDAARKIADVVSQYTRQAASIVSFASVFGPR